MSLISSVVFIYRRFYINSFLDDTIDNNRFFYLLFLFVVSMFFLIFSYSWVLIILGWDGLGVVSFLLVIYYNNSSRLDSGLITIFTNRLGDCFFILSFIFLFYSGWRSLDYLLSFDYKIFSLLIFLGCITKRAQIPFSSWLPAAIAAPTPVSSLVHSSTLVTAGVYLLIRFNFFFEEFFFFIIIVSLFTIFSSGCFAIYEYDFKKVVAISTLRQLGFIIFSLSIGYWWIRFLHIIFHAFFKRILFLSTGRIIHFLLGDQDSRLFGGFLNSFFSKIFFSISCLRLIGFPFSLGFYSKDTIISSFFYSINSFIFIIFFISCCFTVCYRFRLIKIGFLNFPSFGTSIRFIEEFCFFTPILLLFFFCVFSGNFFFINFLSVRIFSFLEYFLGLVMIFSGFLLFLIIPQSYKIINSFSNIIFLTPLVIVNSLLLNKFNYKEDLLWGENSSSNGVSLRIYFFFRYGKWLYNLKFLQLMSVLLFFFVVVM